MKSTLIRSLLATLFAVALINPAQAERITIDFGKMLKEALKPSPKAEEVAPARPSTEASQGGGAVSAPTPGGVEGYAWLCS